MTIITPNSILGITSVTSQSSDLQFYESTGTPLTFSNLQTSSINGGPLAGSRNKIINGAMEISQRGTSFASVASGTYVLDRYFWGQVGSMGVTISQSTDVPNNTFQNSFKVDVTTADTSIAAGDVAQIQHIIEGYNVRDLIGQTFTLSFWVKSPKTGIHCASFRNDTPDRSYILEYTVSSANTWEYKTLTVPGGLITAGTWNWTNGRGLRVSFALAVGSTFQNTPGSWQTGNFTATSSQVNVMDNTANDFFLTGIQLEVGSVATPFERRIYGQELFLCQRYYCITIFNNRDNATGASQIFEYYIHWPAQMRATPTTTVNTTGIFNATVNVANPSIYGARSELVASGSGDTRLLNAPVTASAEL
jgi:hypothetical protein